MARDKASHTAFSDALEQKKTNSVTAPTYDHTDYSGDGDYEFTAHFYTQPPSPLDILKHAIKPDGETPNPEDHLPEAMGEPRDAFGGMKPGPWQQMDHDHIVSGGQTGMAVPEIIGEINPDAAQPQLPGDQGIPNTPGVEELPGNPQMQPSLPGNIGNVIKNPGGVGDLAGMPKSADRKGKSGTGADIPEMADKPKTSEPFKISEDDEEK